MPASLITTSLRRRRSIPYSSGLRFEHGNHSTYTGMIQMSQSLIPQVSDSNIWNALPVNSNMRASQSLIHQVSDSNGNGFAIWVRSFIRLNPLFIRSQIRTEDYPRVAVKNIEVSIPYSSGLSFERLNGMTGRKIRRSLNPLFIRSQFRTAPYFFDRNADT